jgi:hypothetical protein
MFTPLKIGAKVVNCKWFVVIDFSTDNGQQIYRTAHNVPDINIV